MTIYGVGGNAAANGEFNATVISPSTFSLNGSDGTSSAAYTSGGSWYATGTILHFSIRLGIQPPLPGVIPDAGRPENYLTAAPIPDLLNIGPVDFQSPTAPYVFNSHTAEVVYFLGPNSTGITGTNKSGTNAGALLFALYRRQIVAADDLVDSTALTMLNNPSRTVGQDASPPRIAYPRSASGAPPNTYAPQDNSYYEVSCKQDKNASGFLWFNSPIDLTIPEHRFGMSTLAGTAGTKAGSYTYPTLNDQLGTSAVQAGDDILLTNVVSFSVKLLVPKSGSITNASNAAPITITSAGHNLTTGSVLISGALGNTAANGVFNITVIDANTFRLNGSTGSGTYTSGGVWTSSDFINHDFIDVPTNGKNTVLNALGANVFDTWSFMPSSSGNPYDYSGWNSGWGAGTPARRRCLWRFR